MSNAVWHEKGGRGSEWWNITAAIFLLKGLKPETFRDRIEQISIQDIDPNKVSPELHDKIANVGNPKDTPRNQSASASREITGYEGTAC